MVSSQGVFGEGIWDEIFLFRGCGGGDVKLGYDFFWVVRFTNKKTIRQSLLEFAACQFNSE